MYFSRSLQDLGESDVQAFHDAAFRRLPGRPGRTVSIRNATLIAYMATLGGVLMRQYSVEGQRGYVCELIMESDALSLPEAVDRTLPVMDQDHPGGVN